MVILKAIKQTYKVIGFYLFFIMSLLSFNQFFAQGGLDCDNAAAFCGSTTHQFPANGPSAPSGPEYGCMQTQPNAVWYYMQIDQSGTIGLTMGGSGLDIDFAMWGPFTDHASGCQAILDPSGGVKPIQSSWASSKTENIGIGMSGGSNSFCASGQTPYGQTTPPAAQAGEFYIILVSNYTTSSGSITFNQTGGTGSADCTIVNPVDDCGIDNLTATAACSGGSVTVSGSVEVATTLTTGTMTVSSSCGGSQVFNPPFPTSSTVLNYSFNDGAPDGQQCTITVSFSDDPTCQQTTTVTKPTTTLPPDIQVTPGQCSGADVVMIGNYDPNNTYTFTPAGPVIGANGDITGATPGVQYTLDVSSNGCGSASGTFSVSAPQTTLTTPLFTNPGPVCQGTSFTLPNVSTNGVSGTWSPAVNTTETTTYTFTANPNECAYDTTMTVVVQETPVVYASPTHLTICSGESINVKLTSDSTGVIFGWTVVTDSVTGATTGTGGAIKDTLFYTGTTSETITYAVVGTKNGCSSQPIYVTVTVNPAPTTMTTITLTTTPQLVEEGETTDLEVTLSPYIPGVMYAWEPPENLSCIDCPNPIATPDAATWYTVNLVTPEGCNLKDSIFVNYKLKCGETFVPTIFSPNQDGSNEVFKVYNRCLKTMELTVYDRWGNKVFFSNDITVGWDGSFKGRAMNTGTYVYRATITLLDGTTEDLKGSITLVR